MPKLANSNANGPKHRHPPQGREVVRLAESLAELVQETGCHELKVQHNEHFLRIRRRIGSAPQVASAAAPARNQQAGGGQAEEAEDLGTPVISQHVGIFSPLHVKTNKPMVVVGDHVETNQTLGWIETMGIRHELMAPRAGTVGEILAEPGEPVEYGQMLMIIQ